MKIKYTLLLFIPFSTIEGAKGIHMPQMPRGLSANKTPKMPKPQQATTPEKTIIKKPKRKGIQGYRKHHTFSDMTYDELTVAKEKNKSAKNWDLVCKYLERMIVMLPPDKNGNIDLKEKGKLIIELADTLFNQQKHDDASKWYTEFVEANPGNDLCEYASYKAIICATKNILSIDRDQSPTEKTIELADAFLKRDVFQKYKTEVEKIRQECYQTLAQSDCNVANFYITYGNYHAAQKRLELVRNEWFDKVPEVRPTIAQLEVALGAEYKEFIVPESSIKLAQLSQPVKKLDMTIRF
jgi:outer membrane assembly lipoprotein YfiO